jgi:hypothetical protein
MTNLVEIDVRANDNATKTVDDVRASLRSLSGEQVTPTIDLRGSTQAVAETRAVSDAVSSLGRQTATPDVELKGGAQTVAEAATVSEAVKEVGKAGSSASGDLEGLGGSLGKLSNLTMPALIGAGVALSPVIATVGTGLAGFGFAAEQTISPIMKASQAAGGLQANMSSLSPVQQMMAGQLLGLQAAAGKFTASLQPEVVSLWGNALKLAGGLLGDIQPVAKAAGGALSTVVGEIGADLKTSQWQQFFGWMAQEAGPDVQQLGKLFISLMNTLPPLLESLQPVASEFLTLATDAAQAVSALEKVESIGRGTSDSANSVGLSLGGVESAAKRAGEQLLNGLFPGFTKTVSAAKDLADKADRASTSVQAAASSTQAAVTPADNLARAMSTAATDTTALDTAWNTLVGNFNSEQQAIVAAKTAVEGYGTAVKQSGAGSLAAQSQFFAAVQSLQQMTDAEAKNHAPASQLYNDLQAEIRALQSKGPLNKAEQQDLKNLQAAASAVATSTQGLSSQETSLARVMENSLLPQVTALHTSGTTLNNDMKNLAASILNTGTQSNASKGARAEMIADLEKSGVDAKTAKSDVDNFISSLKSIPKSVSSTVTVHGSGSGTITFAEQNIKNAQTGFLEFHAAGGRVGGTGDGDTVHAMLTPGEVVVPKAMVQAGAVDHLRGKLPGFAAGGLVDTAQFAGAGDWMASAGSSAGRSAEADAAAKMIADAKEKIAAQAAAQAAAAAHNISGVSTAGVSNSSAYAALQSAAAKLGWTGAEWTALNNVEMREAGYNLTATNPSSGAYGMAQFINGPSEYYTYGGNPNTAAGQAVAMVNYDKSRYGDPEAAWAHEVAFGWYDKGGWLKPGLTLAYNGTGSPEPVGGAGGGSVTVYLQVDPGGDSAFEQFMVTALRNWVRTKGGVGPNSVQQAFGRT